MRFFSTIVRSLAVPSLLVSAGAWAQGQQGSGSPYSAYGLGEFTGGSQIAQALMGGLGVAVVDNASTVTINPASYASLRTTVFETGLRVRSSQYASAADESNGRRTDLLGLTIGIPFGSGRWGLAVGLNPQSRVGYLLMDTRTLPGGEGNVTYRYTGEGGLNQALLGASYVLVEKRDSLYNGRRLSIGANLGYVFGSIEESRKTVYPTQVGFYNTSVFSSLIVRDPTATIGLQYQGDLRKRKKDSADDGLRFLAGASLELPASLGARRTDVVNSYGFNASGVEVPIDTSFFADGTKGSLDLPLGYGFGFTVYDQHWTVSAEVRQRDWRRLKVNVEGYSAPSELAANATFIVGASYRPANEGVGNLWQRSIYRAGLRYTNDYLVVGGNQLQEKAVSVGLSLPVLGSITRSRINLGGEFGERGTVSDGLVRERFAMLFVGISITPSLGENWFKKRPID
ncbi:MAG: hypothetical protein JNM62_12775 [Flavobacteriales bacterium]|nr:hypothetical protein [Flavobacteriales bacterium]